MLFRAVTQIYTRVFVILATAMTMTALLHRLSVKISSKPLSLSIRAYPPHDRDLLHEKKLSHNEFLRSRDWKLVENFWSTLVRDSSDMMPFITGDRKFGVTNLKELYDAGMRGEFTSKDLRYCKKRTFALRVGYVGNKYNGFQRQVNVEGVHTVEDDLLLALGCTPYGAGRTDADVSAVSQIVSMIGKIDDTAESILDRMRACEAVKSGRLAVYDCVRVPKKFNARSSATWRRYLYMLPLNVGVHPDGFDIDTAFVNEALGRIVDLELPYNGFADGLDRTLGHGSKDLCTLYRARAFRVDLPRGNNIEITRNETRTLKSISKSVSDIDEKADYFHPHVPTSSALCIELVGSRFLRKMVRNLVATTARESVLPKDIRNVNILLDVCNSGDRYLAAAPVPGVALCFAGVGYDPPDLAILKFSSKKAIEKIVAENEIMYESGRFRRFNAREPIIELE